MPVTRSSLQTASGSPSTRSAGCRRSGWVAARRCSCVTWPTPSGISWSRRGVIVFAPGPTAGLWRVDEAGGAAEPLTVVDFEGDERTHRWPHVLPDGSGVLFTVGRAGAVSFDDANLAYAPMTGTGHRILMPHATDGRLLTGGLLAWARGGCILTAAVRCRRAWRSPAPRAGAGRRRGGGDRRRPHDLCRRRHLRLHARRSRNHQAFAGRS